MIKKRERQKQRQMLKSIEHQIRFLGEFVTRNVRKKKNITGNFDEIYK